MARFLQENDDEQITVVDLVEKMEEYLGNSASTAYGRTHMKARLQEHFGDQIIITEINVWLSIDFGYNDLVTEVFL